MKLVATVVQMMIPAVDALGHLFRSLGGKNDLKNGKVIYTLSPEGENYFSSEAYDVCNSNGVEIEGATMYVVVPGTMMDNLVPVAFPDCKMMVNTGTEEEPVMEEVRRQWQEYAPFHWELADGSYLIRCVHVLPDAKSGNGLSNDERLVWEAEFTTLMVKVDGESLMPVPSEVA